MFSLKSHCYRFVVSHRRLLCPPGSRFVVSYPPIVVSTGWDQVTKCTKKILTGLPRYTSTMVLLAYILQFPVFDKGLDDYIAYKLLDFGFGFVLVVIRRVDAGSRQLPGGDTQSPTPVVLNGSDVALSGHLRCSGTLWQRLRLPATCCSFWCHFRAVPEI